MIEPKVFLGALFLLCMLGLWFALMVRGRREDFDLTSQTRDPPRWLR
jgi:hypothetical protein